MGHQLLTWAADKHGVDAQCRLSEILFLTYLERCGNLGDRDTLLAAVKEAELPEEEAKEVLLSGAYEDRVVEEVHAHAKKYRISGVPFFIMSKPGSDREVCLSGAQEAEEIVKVLRDLLPAPSESKSKSEGAGAGAGAADGAATAAAGSDS